MTLDLPENYKNKIRKIEELQEEYKWTIQYDDRLNAFYVFLFPTPILGITVVDVGEPKLKIFPVAGNSFLQKKATDLLLKLLGVK